MTTNNCTAWIVHEFTCKDPTQPCDYKQPGESGRPCKYWKCPDECTSPEACEDALARGAEDGR